MFTIYHAHDYLRNVARLVHIMKTFSQLLEREVVSSENLVKQNCEGLGDKTIPRKLELPENEMLNYA